MRPMTNLIELKANLRRLSKVARTSLHLDANSLAEGYRQLVVQAPRRAQGYLSARRTGLTASGLTSNRREEHLAIGLFNQQTLTQDDGSCVKLIDYQFPLKSARADSGIGKIDLLGLGDDGVLSAIELKVAGNTEDRRIALVEALIYAAILEANIDQIANELSLRGPWSISRARRTIKIVAPPAFWVDAAAFPSSGEVAALVAELCGAIPISIELLSLQGIELLEPGLAGQPPRTLGRAWLSPIESAERPPAAPTPVNQTTYLDDVRRTLWSYSRSLDSGLFDRRYVEDRHPPVFDRAHAHRNILLPPAADPTTIGAIVHAIPTRNRHRAFASMQSSQALAQSVFAGLSAVGRLDALAGLIAEDGRVAFFDDWSDYRMQLEHEVTC